MINVIKKKYIGNIIIIFNLGYINIHNDVKGITN